MEGRWAARADVSAHAFAESLDDEVELGGSDGHHLERVLRLRPGEAITLADGGGVWRPYRVVAAARGSLRLGATGDAVTEPLVRPALGVAFAITKGVKPELVVQKLTELGVDRIVPLDAARSVTHWRGERVQHALGRLRRVAREASMQSRRARVPEVTPPAVLAGIVEHPAIVLADPSGQAGPELALPAADEWLLVVGPEGGFTDSERAMLGAAVRMGLGPHVLRAETAALAGAAVLAHRRGGPR